MKQEELKEYLGKGAEIAGGAVGGAIGLIGGPTGAILGGGLGAAISIVIKEIINRKLSNRQEIRVAASTAFIIDGIGERLASGAEIRKDSFFDQDKGRSIAEEIFEGTLLKCRDQYQEKKIKYIAKIFEKAVFYEELSPDAANQILSMADSFTYRKLCVISFFGVKDTSYDTSKLMRDPYSWYQSAIFSIDLHILKQDIFELANLGIIDNGSYLMTSSNDITPFNFKLSKIGQIMFEIMDLNEIEKEDIGHIYDELKYKEEFGVSEHGTKNGVKQD